MHRKKEVRLLALRWFAASSAAEEFDDSVRIGLSESSGTAVKLPTSMAGFAEYLADVKLATHSTL